MIEDQPLPPLPRLEVEGAPGPDEELLRGRERFALAAAEQPGLLQRHADRRLEQPDGVEVAPSARTFLEVGLEQVGGGAEALGAPRGVVAERLRERARVPPSPPLDPRGDVRHQGLVAGEEADIHHRGAHIEPAGGRFALLGRPHRMTDLETRRSRVDTGARPRAAPPRPDRNRRGGRVGRCRTAGRSSPRPYPPTAAIAVPGGAPARANSATIAASTSSERRRAAHTPWCPDE